MKKIDFVSVGINIQEAAEDRDRVVSVVAEYQVSDDDSSLGKRDSLVLDGQTAEGLLFAVYAAINEKEGTSYEVGAKPEEPMTDGERAMLDVMKKRLAEYPKMQAYLDAVYDRDVRGDESKLVAFYQQVESVKEKYPKPVSIVVSPTFWQKLKAFLGF